MTNILYQTSKMFPRESCTVEHNSSRRIQRHEHLWIHGNLDIMTVVEITTQENEKGSYISKILAFTEITTHDNELNINRMDMTKLMDTRAGENEKHSDTIDVSERVDEKDIKSMEMKNLVNMINQENETNKETTNEDALRLLELSLCEECRNLISKSNKALVTEKPLKKPLRHSSENNIHHKQRLYMDSSSHRTRHRRRESSNGCVNQLVGVLHCYNVFLLILGAGVLGLGIWLLVKDFSSREISAIIDSRLFEYVTYALVAGGGSVAVLAFCGCCGTMRQDRYVLCFYGTVLFLVLVVLVGGSVIGIIFRKKITMELEFRFEDTLENNYGIALIKNSENRLITDAWDAMQRTLGCCGAYGDEYSLNSWAAYKTLSKWHKRDSKLNPSVPESCCVPGGSIRDCQGLNNEFHGIPLYGPFTEEKSVGKGNPNLYTTGCLDKAIEYLQKHSLYIAIVSGAVPVFLILGIIVSFILFCNVKPEEDEEEEDEEGQEAEV